MLLAYIDESGDTGPVSGNGSHTYTLGCVLVDADDWPTSFDELVAFRRRIKERFGVLLRDELKANHLVRGGGSIRDLGLSPEARRRIYRAHMRTLHGLKARAFAVVVDKRNGLSGSAVFDLAWETLLQRLERTSYHERCTFMIIHDEGENDRVRRWSRRARRHLTAGSMYGPGSLNNPARMLVDDPMPRQSNHSLFVQHADLVAYAAFRSIIPPGKAIERVCPQTMWSELGDACHAVVNRYKRNGAPPGVVLRD
ncbi:DUF3800 domain-containing protein [Nocardiopsis sp. CNT-189]|uniref:DUF3800 domain-containing protein n=1 Tax=Nocardiopsis oceanisediminis TaxID=2816862 RepID=UPI003B2DAFB5